MALRREAQSLATQIATARENAGLASIPITPDTLTLQQVEALADSLHVTPESLLLVEAA